MTIRSCSWLLTLFMLVISLAGGEKQSEAPIRFRVHPRASHFSSTDKIVLLYELENISSNREFVITSPTVGAEIALDIEGPDGRKITWSGAVYSSGEPGKIGHTLLFPTKKTEGGSEVPSNCGDKSRGGYCLKRGRYVVTATYRSPNYLSGLECSGLLAVGPYRSEAFELWID